MKEEGLLDIELSAQDYADKAASELCLLMQMDEVTVDMLRELVRKAFSDGAIFALKD